MQVFGGPATIHLMNNPTEDVQSAFSPDGKHIAYIATVEFKELR